jgi:uncharacterized protein RhaS with RHS repeats
MGARYYDPTLGRFITQDTWEGRTWEPWTKNLYAYGRGNPVNYVDPTGHASFLADYDPSIDLQLIEFKEQWEEAHHTGDQRRMDEIAEQAAAYREAHEGQYTVTSRMTLEDARKGSRVAFLLAGNEIAGFNPAGAVLLAAAYALATSLSSADPFEGISERYRIRVQEASRDAVRRGSGGTYLYRYWGGASGKESHWFSPVLYASPEMARRMLGLPNANTATNVTLYYLHPGAEYMYSIATNRQDAEGFGAYAIGGGPQVYVYDLADLTEIGDLMRGD